MLLKMAVQLVILLVLIGGCFSQQTNYCKFGRQHTMCRFPPNSGCAKLTNGVDERAKADILRIHNEYRQKVANGEITGQPSASNMKEMIWDDEIAAIAQRWANQCTFQHDGKRVTDRFPDVVGQNIAIHGSSDLNMTADFGAQAIKPWFDEVSIFSPRDIEPFQFQMSTGHYTQVVWAETFAVGCGYAVYQENAFYQRYYVCNYGPGGNMKDGSMYKRGAACSTCETKCSDTYPGLCQVTSATDPVTEPRFEHATEPELEHATESKFEPVTDSRFEQIPKRATVRIPGHGYLQLPRYDTHIDNTLPFIKYLFRFGNRYPW